MIEVEKKFIVQHDELTRLIRGAHFLGETKHTDVYYDTADYSLTRNDIWLRSRSGKFELKFPVNTIGAQHRIISYDEIENDAAICAKLGISDGKTLKTSLVSLGYSPFATITTTRLKYEKDNFHIDVDSADFGYTVLEVELMVDSEDKVKATYQRILDFAAANRIPIPERRTRGKVIEYLWRNNPKHFHALEKAWGVVL